MRALLRLTVLVCSVAVCSVVSARPVRIWSYDELTNTASLVVIATPVEVRDTGEQTTVPLTSERAVRMETTFEVLAVFKGDRKLKKLIFDHLKAAGGPNGANLVSFDPKQKKRYLLFVKQEKDDWYSSVTGQTDPVYGIKDLGTDH